MNMSDAIDTLRTNLAASTSEQLADLRDCSTLGGGTMYHAEMPGDPPESFLRQAILHELEDAIALDLSEGDGEFVPCHAGDWHDVLATLVVENDWAKIAEIAKDLRERDKARTA